MRIFLSYGHDEYAFVAERLKADLEERGHEVWFDRERLKPGLDWETYIEAGLKWVSASPAEGRVVVLMTPHSMRRPDGYCLNELAYAVARRLTIVPVMLVWCEPPLSICRIQWLDMQDCIPLPSREARYVTKLTSLVDALERNAIDTEGSHARLLRLFDPPSFEAEVAAHQGTFVGRQWLLDEFRAWLDSPEKKILWIVGKPGIGKSAFAAWLCHRAPEIAAFHFCRHGNSRKSDPKRCVLSLAFQLCTQLPHYQDRIASRDLESLIRDANARAVMDELLVQPFSHMFPDPGRQVVVLLDGLDEASDGGRNELASFLATEFPRTPGWMRLVVTSRPDPEVVYPMQGVTPLSLDASSPQNAADLREFFARELSRSSSDGAVVSEATLESLLRRSEGTFLYARWAVDEVAGGRLALDDIESLPSGPGGIYAQFFERQFPDSDRFRREAAPALEIVAATYEPTPLDLLRSVLAWDEHEERDFLRQVGSLFLIEEETIRPFHRSAIDWLRDPTRSGPYHLDLRRGHESIADFGWKQFEKREETPHPYVLNHLSRHLATLDRRSELRRLCDSPEWFESNRDRPLDESESELIAILKYFADENDVAGMLSVATSVHVQRRAEVKLPGYESYLIWYAAVLARRDDPTEIERARRFVEAQPSGLDRLRMTAELAIGLAEHPAAEPFRLAHRSELLRQLEEIEPSGLDLLAAEALGDIDQAYARALAVQEPDDQRLCRILKLIRRHPRHPHAAHVLQTLIRELREKRYPYTDWDASIAAMGLLGGGPAWEWTLAVAVGEIRRTRHDLKCLAALNLAVFLADRLDSLGGYLDRLAYDESERAGVREYQLALLLVAWFRPETESPSLLNRLVPKPRPGTKTVKPLSFWRTRVLIAHYQRLVLKAGTESRGAHEAILVPLFALWARLYAPALKASNDPDEIAATVRSLVPYYVGVFRRDEPGYDVWIELGQALVCDGDVAAADALLVAMRQASPPRASGWRRISFYVLGPLVLLTFLYLFAATVVLVSALYLLGFAIVALAAIVVFSLTLPRQALIYDAWLRGRGASEALILKFESLRGRDNSWWLEGSFVWQFAMTVLLQAGRADLAYVAIPSNSLSPESFLRWARPRVWGEAGSSDALPKAFDRLVNEVSARDKRVQWDAALWKQCFAELLTSRREGQSRLPPAGLELVARGAMLFPPLARAARRFGGTALRIRYDREVDELQSCLSRIADHRDFLAAIREMRRVRFDENHLGRRLAAETLQVSLHRPRDVFAEALHAISGWDVASSAPSRAAMRAGYVRVVRESWPVPRWSASPVVFWAIRFVYRVLRYILREEYSRPGDAAKFVAVDIWKWLKRG